MSTHIKFRLLLLVFTVKTMLLIITDEPEYFRKLSELIQKPKLYISDFE